MTVTVTKLPTKYTDPDKSTITTSFVYTTIPTGMAYVNFLGTDVYTEAGKQTWFPGEARLVSTTESARLIAEHATLFEASGGPGVDALGGG